MVSVVDPAFAPLVRCPGCHANAVVDGAPRALSCHRCERTYPRSDRGYFDLLLESEHTPVAVTPAQRLMESELFARVYERMWRPTFVRLMGGKGAGAAAGGFAAELFIHKSALGMDDRDGPWLDLSCGPGLFARAMAACCPGETVVGLDVSRPMLEAAAQRCLGYDNVTLVRADAQDLPFADRCFGGVNNAGALHVYDDPGAAFQNVYRVLERGGVYVGSTFTDSRGPLWRAASRLTGIRRFDPQELRAWLSRIGFADYEEIRFGQAFIFKARKA
jgi:SAM-dependent methyltransferase